MSKCTSVNITTLKLRKPFHVKEFRSKDTIAEVYKTYLLIFEQSVRILSQQISDQIYQLLKHNIVQMYETTFQLIVFMFIMCHS